MKPLLTICILLCLFSCKKEEGSEPTVTYDTIAFISSTFGSVDSVVFLYYTQGQQPVFPDRFTFTEPDVKESISPCAGTYKVFLFDNSKPYSLTVTCQGFSKKNVDTATMDMVFRKNSIEIKRQTRTAGRNFGMNYYPLNLFTYIKGE